MTLRMALHTGLVVVGELGDALHRTAVVVGETTTLALVLARQALLDRALTNESIADRLRECTQDASNDVRQLHGVL